jgi:hypothetical protein
LFVKPSRKKPVVYSKHPVIVNTLAWAVDCFITDILLVQIMAIKRVLDIEVLSLASIYQPMATENYFTTCFGIIVTYFEQHSAT